MPRFLVRHRRILSITGFVLVIALWGGVVQHQDVPIARALHETTKDCRGPSDSRTAIIGDTVTCTLTIRAVAGTPPEIPSGTIVVMNSAGENYRFDAISFDSSRCIATGGTSSVCGTANALGRNVFQLSCTPTPSTATCAITQVVFTETLTITAVGPGSITQQINVSTTSVSPQTVSDPNFRVVAVLENNRTYYVGSSLTVPPPTDASNGCTVRATPCATINRAHEVAADGDTIRLLPGVIRVTRTVAVNKLVTIEPDVADSKVFVKGDPGITIFQITAPGTPARHVIIRDLIIGGNYREGSSSAAFFLIGDDYTELDSNLIGLSSDTAFQINNGIVLSNSDHPNIHDNVIQGHSRFTFTPVLLVGRHQNGFGIISFECFGDAAADVSDALTIKNNHFNMWLAGIWLCSDGGGLHDISGNIVQNNWRGIALKDIFQSVIKDNRLADNRSDGIIVYGASIRNRVETNTIESHVAAHAAAIRVGWVADPILPFDNLVEANKILRATIAVHVFGARKTLIRNNDMKLSGARTIILLTPAGALGDPGVQPRDTEITGNIIVFTGACAPVIGCALRLLGVTVPVQATDNDWGHRRVLEVEGVIWHKVDDPIVGLVTFIPYRNQLVESTPTPSAGTGPMPGSTGTAPATGAGSSTATATPPSAGAGSGTATPTPTPTETTGNGDALTTTVRLSSGCTSLNWPGASGVSVVDMALAMLPAEAQRTARIWKRENGSWRAWSPIGDAPNDVFFLTRSDELIVCVPQPVTWTVPTRVGG